MLARMVSVARLDIGAFGEIMADENATPQAVAVVVMAGMAIGFGVGPGYSIPLSFVLWWVVWWAIWVFLIYLMGPIVLRSSGTTVDWSRVTRATGFSQSPALCMILLTFVHGLGPIILLLVWLIVVTWWFLTLAVAVKQSLKLSPIGSIGVAGTFLIPSIVIEMGLF